MSKIKNIIFDFGGVLFDIDYQLTQKAFEDLGFQEVEKMYGQYAANPMFENLERGLVTETEFYENLMGLQDQKLSAGTIQQAWNKMLLNFRWESLEHLVSLRGKYRLFLLSNTNSIHHSAFMAMFHVAFPEKLLEDYFEKIWYSHLINLRKPDAEIYRYVLADKNLTPEETLFIDDTRPNIDAAKALGIQTHLLLPGEKIEDLNL